MRPYLVPHTWHHNPHAFKRLNVPVHFTLYRRPYFHPPSCQQHSINNNIHLTSLALPSTSPTINQPPHARWPPHISYIRRFHHPRRHQIKGSLVLVRPLSSLQPSRIRVRVALCGTANAQAQLSVPALGRCSSIRSTLQRFQWTFWQVAWREHWLGTSGTSCGVADQLHGPMACSRDPRTESPLLGATVAVWDTSARRLAEVASTCVCWSTPPAPLKGWSRSE